MRLSHARVGYRNVMDSLLQEEVVPRTRGLTEMMNDNPQAVNGCPTRAWAIGSSIASFKSRSRLSHASVGYRLAKRENWEAQQAVPRERGLSGIRSARHGGGNRYPTHAWVIGNWPWN